MRCNYCARMLLTNASVHTYQHGFIPSTPNVLAGRQEIAEAKDKAESGTRQDDEGQEQGGQVLVHQHQLFLVRLGGGLDFDLFVAALGMLAALLDYGGLLLAAGGRDRHGPFARDGCYWLACAGLLALVLIVQAANCDGSSSA